jgi:hypothetical protein
MDSMEIKLKRRMETILPTDLDLTDYDPELLKKQLDLELVMVTLT